MLHTGSALHSSLALHCDSPCRLPQPSHDLGATKQPLQSFKDAARSILRNCKRVRVARPPPLYQSAPATLVSMPFQPPTHQPPCQLTSIVMHKSLRNTRLLDTM
jgi:hypothetical protein